MPHTQALTRGRTARSRGSAARVPHEPAGDDQEGQFWYQFGQALGGQDWADVEQLLKRRVKKPATLAEWRKMFELVSAALQAEDRRRAGAAA